MSQVATSQLCNFPSGTFQSLSYMQCSAPSISLFQPQRVSEDLTFGKLPFGKLHIWEINTCEGVAWEFDLGEMPNTLGIRVEGIGPGRMIIKISEYFCPNILQTLKSLRGKFEGKNSIIQIKSILAANLLFIYLLPLTHPST